MGIITAGVGFIAGSEAHGIFNQWIDHKLLTNNYHFNSQFRNAMPSYGDCAKAYILGTMKEDGFAAVAALNNISLNADDPDLFARTGGKAWTQILESGLHQLSYAELLTLLIRGLIPADTILNLTKDMKFRQGHKGWFLDLLTGKIPPEIIFSLWNRGIWNEDKAKKELRRSMDRLPSDTADITGLRKLIPPPTELVRFLVRHVWEPDIRSVLGLDDEYDRVAKAIPWFNAVGLFDNMSIPGDGNTDPVDWIKAELATHWKSMSPEQCFVAHQRLRPGREARWRDVAPNATAFTDDILNKALRMDDYVPKMRDWLTAISYRVIPIRQLKMIYEDDIIDRAEVYEIWQDHGYKPVDAQRLTEMLDKQKKDDKDKKDDADNRKRYSRYRSSILRAYEEGSIRQVDAITQLSQARMKTEDIDAQLSAIDIDVNRKIVKQFVAMVRDEFMLGGLDGSTAQAELVSGGLTDERASQYVILWQRKLNRPRRTANAAKLLDWYKFGYIADYELSRRLAILGFSYGDILIYNAEASRLLDENVARIQAAQARTVRQQIEAAARMQREAEARRRTEQAHMRTYSGLVQMRKWFIENEMSETEARSRMTFLDIPQEDQDRYITDWTILKVG